MQPKNFSNIKYDILELKGDNYKVGMREFSFIWGAWTLIMLSGKTSQPLLTPALQLKRLFMNNGTDQIALCDVHKDQNLLWYSRFCQSAQQRQSITEAIDEQFVTSNKALANTMIMKFSHP
ncbi:hypothetical protein CK203_017856 [Vitis vinifera]|uniref:Uncharacterized protein n=1 Tax=Vitis vinifera TaxID=29760 RepID=A0A438JW65_VITVI|nr:hypothetical protein CK203_017856 [Vitis vinifera]